ncbi:helix-turn-helix protein [Jatrophihabitans sp. GAS493]|uniref:helix-turn-helix transcriptional regulator n=1 Tax=Jatrophihabitans sp. GAS493 TaxID=1907575 RepID=UPI000BB9564A|nr:helix-turn-helix transcriptional regulator [Jatrophihabitans sp. GAS493]SOD72258.1 helix-turn-helix protein [Jatrophihabitans sp. GAS493]
MSGETRRSELAAFLRARRAQVNRVAVGLPRGDARRGGGLRREEVAALSGVSITWYTWLEQAREMNPSRQVLDAIARTLLLSETEHSYLLSLAGYASPVVAGSSDPQHLVLLLDALVGSPAFALSSNWTITAWNSAYEALYPHVATIAPKDRNLLWVVYMDPFVRGLLPDWEITSSLFLAEFRAEAGPRLGDPEFRDLIERLLARSGAFRRNWEQHGIEGFSSRRRSFHTEAGQLEFEQHRLAPADQRDVHVVIYTAADAPTVKRMKALQRGAR